MPESAKLRPENVNRLQHLEESTNSLADQLTMLTSALGELADLRQQNERTHTQAELAVVTSLDATNEIADTINPQLTELRSESVTRTEWRKRSLRFLVWGIVGILVLSYTVVSGQQVFSKYCQLPGYLSEQRANVCNMIFIGDRAYVPGVQTTDKVPVVPPEMEQTNGAG